MAADEPPLAVIERAGLAEDLVGDRHLAHVVQLGGVTDQVDLILGQGEPQGHPLGQAGHVLLVRGELRIALGERSHEHVPALATGRRPAGVLLRIHALVGDPECFRGILRLEREEDRAVRAADREAFAVLGERLGRAGHHGREHLVARLEEGTELVASHPVGGPAAVQVVTRLLPRRTRRASPAGWPKVSL